jgi:hypothetical protein
MFNRIKENMKLIKQTESYQVYEDFYQGKQVRFIKDIATGQINVNAHDFAKVMGYATLEEMMSDDTVLDACNEIKEKNGVFPIMKINQ